MVPDSFALNSPALEHKLLLHIRTERCLRPGIPKVYIKQDEGRKIELGFRKDLKTGLAVGQG